MQAFQFGNSTPAIRKVPWERLPLGAIIIDWPTVNDALIPELISYPVMTEALRGALTQRYHFLRNRTVTIVDPALGLEPPEIQLLSREAARLQAGLPQIRAVKAELRDRWRMDPEAAGRLADAVQFDESPYTLTKSWLRSLSTIVRSAEPFGAALWPSGIEGKSLSALVAELVTEQIRLLEPQDTLVDVGVDVSYSMAVTGKAELAWSCMVDLMSTLSTALAMSTWRAWLISDEAVPVDWLRSLGFAAARGDESTFEVLLRRHRVRPGETSFSPFFRSVTSVAQGYRRHLCVLITDGVCQDRSEALRMAERLRKWNIDYLQLVIHRDDDLRHQVITRSSEDVVDGYLAEDAQSPEDEEYELSDAELAERSSRRLREITDIAEAAHGGQLVLNWIPLLGYLAIDVYEQWLGEVIASL